MVQLRLGPGLGLGFGLGLGLGLDLGLKLGLESEGEDSCLMNQSQNVMAQAILYVPFHCGAPSLRLHLLRMTAGSKPLSRSDLTCGQDYGQG